MIKDFNNDEEKELKNFYNRFLNLKLANSNKNWIQTFEDKK